MSEAVVMVLDDGETYSGIRGCMATLVDDTDAETIERQLDEESDKALFFIHNGPFGVMIELTELGQQRVSVIS